MFHALKAPKAKTLLTWGLAISLTLVAGAAFAASSAHGGGEAKHWLMTDTARVMNFAVLAGLLFFVLRKPVSEALSGRIEAIKSELETLEGQKADAEKTLAEYKTKIASLASEKEQILAQYKVQGEAAKKRILEEAETYAEKLEIQAKRNNESEFKSARAELKAEIMAEAFEKAEALIQEKISGDDQDKLVDDYLEKVVV